MADTFEIKLTGNTLPDHPRELAAKALAAMMRITQDQALDLLSGRETVIKRNLDADQVPRYLQAIESIGVNVRAERTSPSPNPATVPPQPAAPSPLTLVPIQAPEAPAADTIKCPACGAEQPKRNLCRNCGADMPRMLAAQAEAKRQPEPASPFAPPSAAVRDVTSYSAEPATPSPLALSFQGRIGRLRYLAYAIPAYLPLIVGALIGGIFGGFSRPGVGFAIFVGLGALATMVLAIRIFVLRLHDLNLSGLWVLLPFGIGFVAAFGGPTGALAFAAIIGLGSLALLFVPGSTEANDYGPPPGPNTVWTTIGAIVMIGLTASSNAMAPKDRFGKVGLKANPAAEQKAE